MRDRLLLALIVATAIVMSAVAVKADVPQLINYQGLLLDASGQPVTTPVSVDFSIYDVSSGGSPVWVETRTVQPDGRGMFSINLGESNPIVHGVFAGPDRWLGIRIPPDPEMIPRTRFTSVAYSYRVATVDGATGGVISGDVAIQSNLDVNGDILVTGKATIGPGHNNSGVYAFVAGENNTVSGSHTTVGGGLQNTASLFESTVSGGRDNTASGQVSTVGGGSENTASGSWTTVGGGAHNAAAAPFSTVGGGSANTANDNWATVGGGDANAASGTFSTVGGGSQNTASGAYSAILGGRADTITADYSYLFGIRSKLTHDSTFMVDMPYIHFGDEATGYKFPASDGASDQVMATDGNGQLSWVNISGAGGGWVDDGTVVRLENSTDYVGIGTTNPGANLHIAATSAGSPVKINIDAAGIASAASIRFENGGGLGKAEIYYDIAGEKFTVKAISPGSVLNLWGRDNDGISVDQHGDVGIGTTTPSEKLDVDGNIHASGTITSGSSITIDGTNDKITASSGTIDFDNENLVTTGKATIGPGHTNTGANAFVAGQNNTASGAYSVIPGGLSNVAGGDYSFATGRRAKANHNGAFVWADQTDADFSSTGDNQFLIRAGGGVGINTNSPGAALHIGGTAGVDGIMFPDGTLQTTAITGGGNWTVTDSVLYTNNYWGLARGGTGNLLYGDSMHTLVNLGVACTTGGQFSYHYGNYSTITGGRGNKASNEYSTISGGRNNTASGNHSFVAGGAWNTASGGESTVGGGSGNTASGEQGTVCGGVLNTASWEWATVGGGENNTASGFSSTVGGGSGNTASGPYSTIGGGHSNTASHGFSTVGGGSFNKARGQYSVVCGGGDAYAADSNAAIGDYSAIGGGRGNEASGLSSTLGGGGRNTASGAYSVIPGGLSNVAGGDYSFAAGRRAKANHHGAFVWADQTDADFASTGADQFLIRASAGVGIGTTSPQGALDVSSTTGAFIVPRMTTAQRNALTAVNGMIVYNTINDQFNFYENGAWVTK